MSTFKIGKRYRTHGMGHVTGPLRCTKDAVYGSGYTLTDGIFSWTSDGFFSVGGHSPDLNLIPGAIEDEKPKVEQAGLMVVDAFDMHKRFNVVTDTMDELRRRINVQGTTIASMAAKIEEHTKQITEHDQSLLNNGHEHLPDRLDALERLVGSFRVDQLQFNQWLANAAGKPITENWRDELKAVPTKPTIKGGWVNVYRGRQGFAALSAMTYETKDEANFKAGPNRLACIQIPDITEGEGL